MKKLYSLLVLLNFWLLVTAQNSSLVLLPEHPEAGKELSFIYTGPSIKDTAEKKSFVRISKLNKNLMEFLPKRQKK